MKSTYKFLIGSFLLWIACLTSGSIARTHDAIQPDSVSGGTGSAEDQSHKGSVGYGSGGAGSEQPVIILARREGQAAPEGGGLKIELISTEVAKPGSEIFVTGKNFDPVPERNTVTIAGLPVEVLDASEFGLQIRLPASPRELPSGTYDVIISNEKAGRASVAIRIDADAPRVRITSPSEGATFTGTVVTVTGTIDDDTAAVYTTGIPKGIVKNGRFKVPFAFTDPEPGKESVVTVLAMDPVGNTTELTRKIVSDFENDGSLVLTIEGNPTSLEPCKQEPCPKVRFVPAGAILSRASGFEWDFDSDGTVDTRGEGAPGTIERAYPRRGVYDALLTVTDRSGAVKYSAIQRIVVVPEGGDASILSPEQVFNAMLDELAAGNIERALEHFRESSSPKYSKLFHILRPEIDELASNVKRETLQHIQTMDKGIAEYKVEVFTDADGPPREVWNMIYFTRDERDQWKIHQF